MEETINKEEKIKHVHHDKEPAEVKDKLHD